MSDDLLNYAGEWKLDECVWLSESGLSIDIRNQVDQITIYEDLYSPVMSGNLLIIDTLDFGTEMTKVGGDLLRMNITTPGIGKDFAIKKYFHIHKLSDRVILNERSVSYILHFVALDSYTESNITVSKTFKGKAEDNIQHLLQHYVGTTADYTPEKTNTEIPYTSNNWSAFSNIAYNCDHAVSAVDGTPSMMFFESRYGYEFKSLVGMSNVKKPYMVFLANDLVSKISNGKMNGGDIQRDFDQDFGTVLSIEAPIFFDYYKDKLEGSMNSRLFSFDFTTKRVVDKTFKANEDNRSHGNPTIMYSDHLIDTSLKTSFGVIPMIVNRHQKLYNGVNETTDYASRQRRIAIMRQFQQHKVEITVLGRTDYTVGIMVYLNVNKMRNFAKDEADVDIADPMLTGNYVVSAVRHRFGADGKHECTLELIRDSIGKA